MSQDLVVFIHAANLSGVSQRVEQFISLIKKVNLYDIVKEINICYVGHHDFPYKVKDEKIFLKHMSNDLASRERLTLLSIWQYSQVYPSTKILYIHTKGVGKEKNDCIEDWIQYMLYFNIEKWREAIVLLNDHDTVGVDLLENPCLHYSGNFWWANSSYIHTLPNPILFEDITKYPNPLNSAVHNHEFWICSRKQQHYSLWNSMIQHHHAKRYPREKYENKKKKTLCILFLTGTGREQFFPSIVDNLAKCQFKQNIHFMVLTNKNNDPMKFISVLHNKEIDYSIHIAPEENNYLVKIQFGIQYAEQNGIPYIMKHDNDILCPHYLYDYLFENMNILENEKNLLLTPTLTSGIPTVEQFVHDFFSFEEKQQLESLLLRYRFGETWGVDFSSLNKHTIETTLWNPKEFFESVKLIPHVYQGIHPIRLSSQAITYLNEIVLQKKKEIFSKRNYNLVYDNVSPYFCNSIFIIKTSTYKKINESKELFVDPFEEVPVNLYRKNNNLNIVYTENGAAVHVIYNSIHQFFVLEHIFMNIFNHI